MAQDWQSAFSIAGASVAALLDTPGEQLKPLYISGARSAAPTKLLPAYRSALLPSGQRAALRAQQRRSRALDGTGSRLGLRLGRLGYDGGTGSPSGRVRALESRVARESPM